jgi:hypothetical protein
MAKISSLLMILAISLATVAPAIQDTNLDDDFSLTDDGQDSGPGSTALGEENIKHGSVTADPLYYDSIELDQDLSLVSLQGHDEKFLTQCALTCISVYSRVVKNEPYLQQKIDEKLKSRNLEQKTQSMILEKYIIDSLTKCVKYFSSWQEKDLKVILDTVYSEKLTHEQMKKYIQYDDSILDDVDNPQFDADQLLVHKTLGELQEKMKASQKDAEAKGQAPGGQPGKPAGAKGNPSTEDLEQAWAFLGMMVILVTTVFSMICICCCLKEKKEGELAGKLDVVLKKLEAKRAKITELAEEQENLQNELKNMEGEAKELATGPGQAKAK